MKRLLVALALFLVAAPPAQAFTKQSGTRTMDDGVSIAYDLYLPSAATVDAPGTLLLHGFGGSKESVATIAGFVADRGYAVLAYSARGHGSSGGDIELAGPRDVKDERAMFEWFRSLAQVGDAVGCAGISYGGGVCWNGVAAGIPFGAVEVFETWTDFYSALWPANVARSGVVAQLLQGAQPRSPLVRSIANDAVRSTNLGRIRALAAERSPLPKLGGVTTPVYLFQGGVDWLFDVAQATRAFARLSGPKKLYVGNFGHTPSSFPGGDISDVLAQSLAWFDRFLRGVPNGIEQPGTTIWTPHGNVQAASLPATRTLVLKPGSRISSRVDTFGGGAVVVSVKRLAHYPRLVAVVFANGRVVTHGGVVPHRGRVSIPLASYVQTLPQRARITLRLASDSGPTDSAYARVGNGGSIALGPATIRLSVLR